MRGQDRVGLSKLQATGLSKSKIEDPMQNQNQIKEKSGIWYRGSLFGRTQKSLCYNHYLKLGPLLPGRGDTRIMKLGPGFKDGEEGGLKEELRWVMRPIVAAGLCECPEKLIGELPTCLELFIPQACPFAFHQDAQQLLCQ